MLDELNIEWENAGEDILVDYQMPKDVVAEDKRISGGVHNKDFNKIGVGYAENDTWVLLFCG